MLTFKRKSGVNYYHNSTFRIKPESRRSANSTLRKMSANTRRRVADYRSRATGCHAHNHNGCDARFYELQKQINDKINNQGIRRW